MKILFFILIIMASVFCQSQQLRPDEAESLFSKKRFSGVWEYYLEQLKKDSLNASLNYKMGVCYLNSRSQKEKAIQLFKQAIAKNELGKQKQCNAYKLLGDAYYYVSDYDQAILYYEKYKNMFHGEAIGDISKEIEMCRMANDLKELKELTATITDNKTGSKKNSKNLYAFHESSASLKHTSPVSLSLKKTTPGIISDKNYFEELQDAGHYDFKRDPKKIDTTETSMETTVATSVDGQIILIYRDDNGNGNLYCSFLKGNDWMQPEPLSRNIINKSWEPNEYITANGNELYFSSDREGGFGGKDIYKCLKLSNGEWGKAVNMGSTINTKYDEEAPYIYPDGLTFYFSSDRNRKKGVFDNYSSSFSDSAGWSVPDNVGYPVFKTNEISTSDSATGSSYLKANYIATFVNPQKKPITILKGMVADKNGTIPPYIEITIANNETGEITGIYHPASKTGKYAFILPIGKNQNISYEADGYLYHSENVNIGKEQNIYQLNKLIELEPLSVGAKIKLNNVFFDDGKSSLKSTSDIEVNKLASFLMAHPTLKVEIAAYVNKKSDETHIKLTEEKIRSLINILFEKGADKKNIQSAVYKRKNKKSELPGTESKSKAEKLELKIIALK